MDQMDQTQQSQTGPQTTPLKEEKSTGALIGSIIIVAIVVIGGIYFWIMQAKNIQEGNTMMGDTMMPMDTQTEMLMNQGTSDEISDIEKDLNATDLQGLDAELSDIEAQF